MNTTTTSTTQEQDIANLTAALLLFAENGDVGSLQAVYRDIHPSRRGNVQAASLTATIGTLGDAMGPALDAMANLPTVTSRTAVRTLTDDEEDGIRSELLNVIMDHDAEDILKNAGMASDDEFLVNIVATALDRMERTVRDMRFGGSRTQHNTDPSDIVPDGATLTAVYKGNDITGTFAADGSVTVDGVRHDSLSAAAKAVIGRPQNGWAFWRYEGATLASLRDAN